MVDTPPEATTCASVTAQTWLRSSRLGTGQGAVLGDVGDDVTSAAVTVQTPRGSPTDRRRR